MFHACLWCAIDNLAAKNHMSCSGMARRSGLDATVFNKSKRYSRAGKPHYPSMKSVEKVLTATGTSMVDFAEMIADASRRIENQSKQ